MLHTSSDGQKFEVKVESLNANHSFKYFGKGKGVSVYSFIDERHLLFHSTVISAAERESAYVIDGLMHNDVVKSRRKSKNKKWPRVANASSKMPSPAGTISTCPRKSVRS